MTNLFMLPTSLLVKLLTDWINMRCLLALDSAICSTASRKICLDVLASKEFCLYEIPNSCPKIRAKSLEWFVARGVKVKRVLVDEMDDLDSGIMASFLRITAVRLEGLRILRSLKTALPLIKTLSSSPTHLKRLELDTCGEIDGAVLGNLLNSCGGSLECIYLGVCRLSDQLPTVHLPFLRMLHLCGCGMGLGTLCKLLSSCPNLESFWGYSFNDRDVSFGVLASHCHRLRVLSYEEAHLSGAASLVQVLRSCQDLKVVCINGVAASGTDEHIAAVMQHCQKLKAFRAIGVRSGMPDASLLAVATARIQQLRHLSLWNCSLQSDAPILALARHCRALRTLELKKFTGNFSQVALANLAGSLAGIVELTIRECTIGDAVLCAIGANCLQLQILNLWGTNGHTESGMIALAQGCTALKQLYLDDVARYPTPVGKRWWSALRPGLEFLHGGDTVETMWTALQDTEREEFVVW